MRCRWAGFQIGAAQRLLAREWDLLMGLTEYRRKRDFRVTAEPRGGRVGARKALSFVIQKHAASHLHYDFRLELAGVLKSWAVPKGPPFDQQTKRLAMMAGEPPY